MFYVIFWLFEQSINLMLIFSPCFFSQKETLTPCFIYLFIYIFICYQDKSIRMPKNKAAIGLSWEPKLSLLSSAPKNGSHKSQNVAESSGAGLWKPDSDLVDGLFVPPNNPRKLNKLLRKQVKDTTGTKWYVHSDGCIFIFIFIPFSFLTEA